MLNQYAATNPVTSSGANSGQIDPAAIRLFRRSFREATMRKMTAWVGSRTRQLAMLETIKANRQVVNEYHQGLRTVEISAIRGTVSKADSFDAGFRPTQERSMKRWASVAMAMMNGASLPPVELILVDDTYYVVDGHHRISVARALGFNYIEAVVKVWKVAV